jgi:FkbM family methyltransferase
MTIRILVRTWRPSSVLGVRWSTNRIRRNTLSPTALHSAPHSTSGRTWGWSRLLTQKFDRVVAFEPHMPYIPILLKNAPKVAEVMQHALGESRSKVGLVIPEGNTGAAYINGDGDTDVIPLDNLGPWRDIDFIKIDCEGYELPVLKGAVETLTNNDPTIIVEQKPHPHFADQWEQYAAIEFLETLGYRVHMRVIDDWILRKL